MGAEAHLDETAVDMEIVVERAGGFEHRLPRHLRTGARQIEDPRGDHRPDTRVEDRCGERPVVQVHLGGGGHSAPQQLVGSEGHAPVHVLVGQRSLAGPDGLLQPPLEREPIT